MGMRADNHALDSLHCTYIIAYLRGQPDSGCPTQVLYRQLSRPSSSCEGLLRQTTRTQALFRGRKGEPDTHCLRMRQNSQKSWEFGFFRKISRILLRVLNVNYP